MRCHRSGDAGVIYGNFQARRLITQPSHPSDGPRFTFGVYSEAFSYHLFY
jgi:hypothetical protein